jgi:hypothetical protein
MIASKRSRSSNAAAAAASDSREPSRPSAIELGNRSGVLAGRATRTGLGEHRRHGRLGHAPGRDHEGTSASGNLNFTGTLVPKHVMLVGNDGNMYWAAGAIWFGSAFNAQTGTGTFTFTEHLVFVDPGGVSLEQST